MSYLFHSFHIIFSTKDRVPLIAENFAGELYKYIGGIIREFDGKLIEIGGMEDHIHLLAHLHQSVPHAHVIRDIKSGSSRWINRNNHTPVHFNWQEKYGSFSVSPSVEPEVVTYIRNQKEHHKTICFQDEFRAFLKKHGQVLDERYLWQ